MKFAVVDCETTGKGPTAELLELAVVVVDFSEDTNTYLFRRTGATLVHIEHDIPPEASAVHHITKDMVTPATAMTRTAAREWLLAKVRDCDAIVAHFVEFDRSFLPELHEMPWICSMVVAKHIWPDAPAYGLQVLRYWQGLDASDARASPHRAIYDAMVTGHLIAREVEVVREHYPNDVVGKLKELTDKIPLLRVVHFGKYRGEPYAEAVRKDRRYFSEFVLGKSDMGQDREIAHTVKHYLRG